MIRRTLSLVGILCIASLLFTDANAKGKPANPGKSNAEWIVFEEDLIGGQKVEGCCPNAGPFPEYEMTLSSGFGDVVGDVHDKVFDGVIGYPLHGNLFINSYSSSKTDHGYMVQFWFYLGQERVFIEIRGGDIDYDRKANDLTVTFTNENCRLYVYIGDVGNGICYVFNEGVNFVLYRYPAN